LRKGKVNALYLVVREWRWGLYLISEIVESCTSGNAARTVIV
jgi:hypothetical protein